MIPLSADEIVSFTPPSLANLATPPVFMLRPVTNRDARAFRRICMVEGLTYHSPADLRAEQLRGLKIHWSEADFEKGKALLESIWDAIDQGVDVEQSDLDAAIAVEVSLGRVYQPIRVMAADNEDFNALAPQLALTLFVVGWQNLDVPYRREAGTVPIKTINELETAILKIERAAIIDKVDGVTPGRGFLQLLAELVSAMNLSQGERQGFPSPSSSASTQTASTTASPDKSGSSAVAPIAKTRRVRSRKTSAT